MIDFFKGEQIKPSYFKTELNKTKENLLFSFEFVDELLLHNTLYRTVSVYDF